MSQTCEKYIILGAGFIGLGIAEALKSAQIPYDQVDASDDIGGNWYHGVYETAHIISSRKVTQFPQFPMSDDYPDFPSAAQMLAYLRNFADHYQLRENIELNRTVIAVNPTKNNLWHVIFANGEERTYKGILICNGHHWCKRFPEFQGEFKGEIIHSKDYKHPEQLRGKRVLVIGGGNSGCDIAAEAARVAAKSFLSLRESVWFIPKTFVGVPVVNLVQWWMPEWVQRAMAQTIIQLTFGPHKCYGLPKPNHRLFTKHPTINNEVPYYIKQGKIIPKPGIDCLHDSTVEFVDGSSANIDLIVCATGYHVAYPFLPDELQRIKGAIVQCYAGTFLDDYKGIYYIGWGQARGGVGSIIGPYSQFLVQCLQLQEELKIPLGLVFKKMGQELPTTHLSDPQAVFRQLKLGKIAFPLIRKIAYTLDSQYPEFENEVLPENQAKRVMSPTKC
ncbi:MAG: NAD(P)-binding domain-containing protein [Roseofilum sp. SBFL]|uniref:flavin-containing monooxygenase n=1 Tax=unclassified Roseofilum TaxID=2620099 RepID=UPI001B0E2A6D|nr:MULTISPECIES: NAD(P)-binding domain-containing protein [unclassified Roseofilum]MBP0015158.1 NAD(P)-binding domain-containing protein [Roseofilum sp. SID3]MBP0023948.1 NAD(P)-binding domain-containing protein [Roseofilum sp. SID2]MBP0039200.1 NAD(P)-binding domain-containing protein [Roseofilum sp. SID1]MBP0043286.1 NAD(P)-binding domain-containing protein [Roseofilum sp. SBFL]